MNNLNLGVTKRSQHALRSYVPVFPIRSISPLVGLTKNTQLAKSNPQSPWIFFSSRQQNRRKDTCQTCKFRILEVTWHESLNKKQTKRKTTILTSFLTEISCGRGHWKYERPFVKEEFHMFISSQAC